MTKRILFLPSAVLIALVTLTTLSACTRVLVHSRDREMEPMTKLFNESVEEAYKAARSSVVRLGYKIHREDESQRTIETGWIPTKASSHYVDLFDRKDFGTVGAYYQIQLKVTERSSRAEVEVSAPVRSVVGRIKSNHTEERKILKKIADLLRKEDFEMTNVGVDE